MIDGLSPFNGVFYNSYKMMHLILKYIEMELTDHMQWFFPQWVYSPDCPMNTSQVQIFI